MDPIQLTAWLTLQAIEGVGDRTCLKLVQSMQTPQAVLAASPAQLVRAGCSGELAERIRQGPETKVRHQIDRQVDQVDRLKIHVASVLDETYPNRLKAIPDPPPLLYWMGTVPPHNDVAVAIVGGRRASASGQAVTEELARDLASAGVTIVSGLARGIDAAAHRGALAGGGRTIAVLGCGVDRTYPPEHGQLRHAIEAQGAVLSELPIGAPPQSHHFPRRNRIISGLAVGVVVTEAATNSGSLITAKLALDQGREVFAVPGSVKDSACRGSNRLLKEGAMLVDCAQDIFEAILPQMDARERAALKLKAGGGRSSERLGAEETLVYDALCHDARSVDTVIETTGLGAAQVASLLLSLELCGRIKQLPGQQYIRL